MLRKVIQIDDEKCNGCGICVTSCNEGALQIIDGKARLINEIFCDGLGACIGDCPEGAITVIEREAEPYDEIKVVDKLLKENSIKVLEAHLKHLRDHNEMTYFNQAMEYLQERGIKVELDDKKQAMACGCPGSMAREIKRPKTEKQENSTERMPSQLEQWPVQLHLVNPIASFFNGREMVMMSTCGPIVNANVHQEYIKNRSVVVACPKLDRTDPYIPKLAAIFEHNDIPRIIVVRIEVPCCGGLSYIAVEAARMSGKQNLTIEEHTLSIEGELINKQILFKN
ncbi:MAG TPA: 4Fe-4S binding protein [Candidatus Kapabacteria bacterium]|nr:4Fe-4S binding protein [Candidatus Kapabacteria bacterium]